MKIFIFYLSEHSQVGLRIYFIIYVSFTTNEINICKKGDLKCNENEDYPSLIHVHILGFFFIIDIMLSWQELIYN